MNIAGNLVCGQVGGETARCVSERFPAVKSYRTSVSVNSWDTSISKSEQSDPAISPATIANLSSGEFVGIVADDPGKEMPLKAFHARVVREDAGKGRKAGQEAGTTPVSFPVVQAVDATMIEENFNRVKREVREMVDAEMTRILGDPALAEMVVRR